MVYDENIEKNEATFKERFQLNLPYFFQDGLFTIKKLMLLFNGSHVKWTRITYILCRLSMPIWHACKKGSC